jgi:hypothetical protein
MEPGPPSNATAAGLQRRGGLSALIDAKAALDRSQDKLADSSEENTGGQNPTDLVAQAAQPALPMLGLLDHDLPFTRG